MRRLAGLALAALLVSCTAPAERAERLAGAAGFDRLVAAGDPFRHVVFVKRGHRPVEPFRVYLEGDGTPWITPHRIAADPTPRRPLMLELMRLDPGPALYLGRPCYFGEMTGCRPELWTGGRYSPLVVSSMVAALGSIRADLGWAGPVTLAGHSGGGVLAMLMAPRLADTAAVVTLAANLDVGAWTRLHGYSPLSGSLDPAAAGPLPAGIRQLHLVGEKDRNVPPRITRAGLANQPGAEILSFPGYRHHCCWEEVWRSILDRLENP